MTAFLIFPFVQALLILLFFVLPLHKVNKYLKVLLAVILVLGSLKIYIYVFTSGNLMDPKLSRYPAMLADAFYFSSIFVFLFTLLRMIVNGIYKLSKLNCHKYIIPAFSTRYACIILLISCALGIKGVINGFAPPIDTNYSIKIDNLNDSAQNLKIIHLADFHISAPTTPEEIQNIVDRVNFARADIVVIAGDFVDGEISELDYMTKILFSIKAKYGVYAVSGNHEFYSGYSNWLNYFENGGIKFLENKGTIISDENGNELVNLCGLIDRSSSRYKMPTPNIKEAVRNINPNLPTIFLTHQPALAVDLKDVSDLTLAGHTHGGLMPGLKQIVAAANKGFVSGWYQYGKEQIIVSNGTRIWAGAPLRLNTPSQINYITLRQ